MEDYALGGKGPPAFDYARQPQRIRLAPGAFSLSGCLYATDRLVNESLNDRIPPPHAAAFGPTAPSKPCGCLRNRMQNIVGSDPLRPRPFPLGDATPTWRRAG